MWAARSTPPEESAPPPGQSLVLPLVQDAATLTQRPATSRADPCALQREVHLPDLQDGDQPQGPPVAPHAAGAWRGPADGGVPAAAHLPLLPQGAAQHGRPRRACRQLPPLRQRERLRCGVGREDRRVPDLFSLLFAGRLRRRMKLGLVRRTRLKWQAWLTPPRCTRPTHDVVVSGSSTQPERQMHRSSARIVAKWSTRLSRRRPGLTSHS